MTRPVLWTLALLSLCSPLLAGPLEPKTSDQTSKKDLGEPAFYVPLKTGDLPAYPVSQLQTAYLSVDQFVLDISGRMRELTKEHDAEMCAKICRNENTIGIVVTTVLSHAVCPVAEICPTGMSATPFDVHTHPQKETYTANAVDVLFLPKGTEEKTTQTLEPNFFSKGDLLAPNSYLIGRDVVLMQDGKTVRVVRDFFHPEVTVKPETP